MTDVDRFPTSTVADVLGPACALDRRIAPVVPGTHLAGRALPVLARDGDNGPVAAAIAAASPGDVLVVDGGAGEAVALLGGLLARRALLAGVAGAVVDGLVRDVDELRELGLPVYARGATPVPPTKGDRRPPADAVGCGGVAVRRGDVVLGDGDGVVVVPATDWERVRALAAEGVRREQEIVAELAREAAARTRTGEPVEAP